MLREVGIYAVPRPDGSAFDHWLYRAEPQLTLDGGSTQRVGVFGAQLEVRIGHGGQPVNVQSRWSPLSGEQKLTDLASFQAPPNADSSSGSQPAVMFLLEGDGVPQYYLAPYYFQFEGLDATMTSASPFSLTVDVSRTSQDDAAMTLTALAAGGSGDYVYNWAVYPITDPTSGIRELGSGSSLSLRTTDGQATASSIQINNGAYVVLLNVKDQSSGAFKHHQQQFFSISTADDSAPTQTA
jgi:hypothetical protein